MSLVGSLEDLGLGDILQIISLSRKSGLLLLRSARGEGRIVFLDGLVRGAFVKGGPTDLRGLVVGGGALSDAAFDAVAAAARARGATLESALGADPTVGVDRLEELRRASTEASVVEMFRWRAGDFSFEIRDESEGARDAGLLLTQGISAQYLAMEATRQRDEDGLGAIGGEALESGEGGAFQLSGEEPESTEDRVASAPTGATAADVVAAAAVGDGDASDDVLELDAIEADGGDVEEEALDAAALASDDENAGASTESPPAPSEPVVRGPAPPVILVDRELATLEWVKSSLAQTFSRVHVFQASEQAITRLRQYLLRGDSPLVVVSDRAPPDPLSGARDAREIIERVKAQSPRTPVFLLVEGEGGTPRAAARQGAADGIVLRPSAGHLANPRLAEGVAQAARRLEHTLVTWIGRAAASAEPRNGRGGEVQRLRDASARLRHPSSRGAVLPLVMGFAKETFSRVAMFMLRDDVAVGIAQLGLAGGGGPDDAALQLVRMAAADSAWLRAVLERRTSVRAAPSDDGDRRLATLLGSRAPSEAYVAPIESGDRVVAVLYGDNLPGGAPIGDTSALEVVLHEAGLALDRAVLERALAEAETRGSGSQG